MYGSYLRRICSTEKKYFVTGDSSSLDNSGGYSNMNRGMAGDRIYATSVPVSVPMFRPSQRGTYDNQSLEDSVSLAV